MFHRLTAPTYIGGLPVGYDYLNNPSGPPVIGVGLPAPVDPLRSGGPNDGVYFVAFGEDGRAGAANRGLAALALNTDVIDDFLHSDTAVTTSVDITGAAIIVGTAANPVYRGPTGNPNTQAGLEPYFHVTDLSNNDIVDVATNTQSVVTSITVNPGVGFFVGSITLAVSPAPVGTYRIWYGTRSSLAEMTKGEFVRQNVWGVQRKQAGFIQFTNNLINSTPGITKGGSLVGVDTTTFNASTSYGGGLGGLGIVTVQQAIQKTNDRLFAGAGKVEINTAGFVDTVALTPIRGGGIGSAFAPGSVQQALDIVDKQLVRRRAFTAVLTDGTATIGGDYNGSNIDVPLAAFVSADFYMRSGAYFITNAAGTNYTGPLHIKVEAPGGALILDPTRTFDLGLTNDVVLEGPLGVVSLATNGARYRSTPTSEAGGFSGYRLGVQAGALQSQGATAGGHFSLEDSYVTGTGVLTATNAALDVAGEIRVGLRRTSVTSASGTPVRAFYLHDITNDQHGSATIEDCKFRISDVGVNALDLFGVNVPTIFRNCLFEITATSGAGYAALIDSCTFIEFDNCKFRSANGQVIKVLSSTVHFRNCWWQSTDAVPGAAASQMVVIQPGGNGPSSITNCHCIIGASSVRGSAAAGTKAVIELGGLDGTATSLSGLQVNRLSIVQSSGMSLMHNYTTILLHGNGSSRYLNSYNDVSFDAGTIDSTGAGTLGGKYMTPAFPAFVEFGGGTRATCVVNNLAITNVKSPSSSHNRYILGAKEATITNVTIDGTSVSGAGSFTESLVVVDSCVINNLRLTRAHPIKCTNVNVVYLLGTTKWRGGVAYFNTSAWPTGSWIQFGAPHCEIREVSMFWSSSVGASTAHGVKCFEENCGLYDCTLWVDGVWTAAKLVSFTTSDVCRIQRNRFFWRNTTVNSMLESTGDFSIVTENQFYDGGTDIPTYSVTGTGAIDDNNVAFGITGPAAVNPVL